jgi:hypothetical protein
VLHDPHPLIPQLLARSSAASPIVSLVASVHKGPSPTMDAYYVFAVDLT